MIEDLSKLDLKALACLVSSALQKRGIDAILVGGACVSIYSQNQYQSYDLDFVTYDDLDEVEEALLDLGFKRKGRYFTHKQTPFLIDFINPPIAVGNEPVNYFSQIESLQLLTPTDCVKDRLAAYYHWDDSQSFEQAVMVARELNVDMDNIRSWSQDEGQLPKFNEFQSRILV